MTSRDGSNRYNRPPGGANQPDRTPQRQNPNWELDAEELDRYMSGQPSREPRFDPYGRSQTNGRTERVQTQRQQPAQPSYDQYPEDNSQDWSDEGVDGEYGYEEYQQPAPAPQRPRQQQGASRQTGRMRQAEPEYDEDLYEDPYVLDDDDDSPKRPARRPQRQGRPRAAAPSASFSIPPFIAEAPLVKDRMALGMLSANLLSAIVMLIVVAMKRDGLTDVIFTHVNANGDPANLQNAGAIWRLPLIAGMVTLISAAIAWFLARWGAFLPRFVLGSAVGVQFFVWVAIIAYLF